MEMRQIFEEYDRGWLKDKIRDYPLTSVYGAAGLGFIAAMFLFGA